MKRCCYLVSHTRPWGLNSVHQSRFHLPTGEQLLSPGREKGRFGIWCKTKPRRWIAGRKGIGPLHEGYRARGIGECDERRRLARAALVHAAGKRAGGQSVRRGFLIQNGGEVQWGAP